MDKDIKIWLNFEKKDMQKGNDFVGQLIYENIQNIENEQFLEYEKNLDCVEINLLFGTIKVKREYFINQLLQLFAKEGFLK